MPPKAPKKRLFLKSKNRVSLLEDMNNPLVQRAQKRITLHHNNKVLKNDSDYSNSETDSDSNSDDEFKPKIENRIKVLKKDKDERPKFEGLKVVGIPTNKNCTPLSPLMEAGIVPKPNGCHLINGAIASGKTNMLCNMLVNKNMWGGFFDNIFLFSNSRDDIWDTMIDNKIIKKQNVKHNPTEKDLERVIKLQKEAIKKANGDPSKFPTTLIILDDIIDDVQLMKSDQMKLLFIRPRQMMITTVILSQYALSVPKIARMQCINLMLFNGNAQEAEMYYEWLAPSGMSKKDFNLILRTAWDKKPDDMFPFMMVARKEAPEKRFRRNFLEVISLDTDIKE